LHIEPPVFKRLCPEKCRTCQTVRCSLQENSGQKLQVGQPFPIGLDEDLPNV